MLFFYYYITLRITCMYNFFYIYPISQAKINFTANVIKFYDYNSQIEKKVFSIYFNNLYTIKCE